MITNFRQIDSLLYRSAALFELTPEDIQKIKDCGIQCVVDLRTTQEVFEKPDTVIDGLEYVHIPIFNESALGITKETGSDPAEALKKIRDRRTMQSRIPRMPALYSRMIFDPSIRENTSKAVRAILRNMASGKKTLFHCTVGKDRAGLVAAIVLHILGRSDKEIMRDYLKTNWSVWPKAYKYFFLLLIFRQDPVSASLVKKAYTVEKSFLNSAYKAMDGMFGGFDEYIKEGLGIDTSLLPLRV